MSNIPSTYIKISDEETSYRDSFGNGVLTKIGGTINQGIDLASPLPLGSIEQSMLNEAQFQGVRNTGWVLMDGRSITGSALHALTGQTVIADSRGRFLRGKDNGRGLDPNGDSPVNTPRVDTYIDHTHASALSSPDAVSTGLPGIDIDSDKYGVFPTAASAAIIISLGAAGTADSRPDNVTVNFFIRIN